MLELWARDGVGILIALLFWFLVVVIALVATASSKSPWDTVIAALAMSSQAGFAYMVYRLGKAQYTFARLVADRQHKIDMFPLRKEAAKFLDDIGNLLDSSRHISDSDVEAFRLCYLEVSKLFSDHAENISFALYEKMQEASARYSKITPVYDVETGTLAYRNDPMLTQKARDCVHDAINLFTDLQNAVDDEMRIR